MSLKKKLIVGVVAISMLIMVAFIGIASSIIYNQNVSTANNIIRQSFRVIIDDTEDHKKRLQDAVQQVAGIEGIGLKLRYLVRYKNRIVPRLTRKANQELAEIVHNTAVIAGNLWRVMIVDNEGDPIAFSQITPTTTSIGYAQGYPSPELQVLSFATHQEQRPTTWETTTSIPGFNLLSLKDLPESELIRFEAIEGTLSLVAYKPIIGLAYDAKTDAMQPQQIGWVIAVQQLNSAFLERLTKLTNMPINLFTLQGLSVGNLPAYHQLDFSTVASSSSSPLSPDLAHLVLNEIQIREQGYFQGLLPLYSNQQAMGGIAVLYSKREFWANIFELLQVLVFVGLGSLLLLVPLSLTFANSISRPLSELTQATKIIASGDLEQKPNQLAQEGHLQLSFAVDHQDELDVLAQNFLHMQRAIHQQFLDLKQLNKTIEVQNQTLELKVEQRTQELKNAFDQLAQQHKDLKRTQTQLVHSEKMAGLGQLIAGIAHEINNPTNFVTMNTSTLEKELRAHQEFLTQLLAEEPELLEHLEQQFEKFTQTLLDIQEGSSRIQTIVADLRTFSRLDEAEEKQANVVDGIRSTLRLITTQYKKTVQFVCNFTVEPQIKCHPAQLNQVFMNIMVNGCQAIGKTQVTGQHTSPGTLTIETFLAPPEANSQWLGIRFTDTGCGMSETIQQRVFEPFYTTKPVGEGTGMGLSISYSIIEKHQGKIQVQSREGQGTTFTILLPLTT